MRTRTIGRNRRYFYNGLMYEALYLGKTKASGTWELIFIKGSELYRLPKDSVTWFYK